MDIKLPPSFIHAYTNPNAYIRLCDDFSAIEAFSLDEAAFFACGAGVENSYANACVDASTSTWVWKPWSWDRICTWVGTSTDDVDDVFARDWVQGFCFDFGVGVVVVIGDAWDVACKE
jgi:hypothetical protein